jgi:exosortase H (IPTLxxWG-CTERM-specific)
VKRDNKKKTPKAKPAPVDYAPAGNKSKPRPRWWLLEDRPVLRFVLLFGLLMGSFEAYFVSGFAESEPFQAYLRFTARNCGGVLNVLGNDTQVRRRSITSPRFSVSIVRGCDAIEPSALFIVAVLAFPAPYLAKFVGVISGFSALMVTNIVRIVSLFYVGIHFSKDTFDRMHYDVWQAVFIFLALLLWLVWARWATGPVWHPRGGKAPPPSDRSRGVMLGLCLVFGLLGVHRFHAKRIGTGIVWVLSGGILTVGWLCDLLVILIGKFTDGRGRLVAQWRLISSSNSVSSVNRVGDDVT